MMRAVLNAGKEKDQVSRENSSDERKSRLQYCRGTVRDSIADHSIWPEVDRVSEQQREILKANFERLEEEAIRNGISVYVRMFQEYPEYKSLFPRFRYMTDEAVSNSQELRAQGEVYMCGFGKVIS